MADTQRTLTPSQRVWLDTRRYLVEHRHELAVQAVGLYPNSATVDDTPLLTAPGWIPHAPIPLDAIELEFVPHAAVPAEMVTRDEAADGLPQRADGRPYRSYAEVIADLAPPRVFEDRPTYRLLGIEAGDGPGRLTFGRGTYFDSINTGEACAHEYAATILGEASGQLRQSIGDPCDPTRRPINVAISTLTVRLDRATGDATFFLHWRDPAKVGHAGGLYQVVPVGVFQASGEAPWNEQNDFDLWRCIIREFAEELRGEAEDYDSERAPIDYEAWPFARTMTRAIGDQVHAYYLGMGVDPLTFATDMLTAVVVDASLFDAEFDVVVDNTEGQVLRGLDFTADVVDRFIHNEPTQAAGAALLALAWRHRADLLR